MLLLKPFFQFSQRLEAMAPVSSDPTLVDLLNGHGIEVVTFLAAVPDDHDEFRLLQDRQVLGYRLPRHVEVLAQFIQRQAIVLAKPIQQISATGIGKRVENKIQGKQLCNHMVACQDVSGYARPVFILSSRIRSTK
jgi:hypothetical protein